MMIFVCGPDGSGKTTLCKRLAKYWGLEYVHFDKPAEDVRFNQVPMYKKAMDEHPNAIFDRNWFCAQVYAPVMRGETEITHAECRELENYASSKGPVMVIHCTDTTDALWARCNARGEDYVTTKDQMSQIRLGYHRVLQQSTLPVFEHYIGQSLFGE